MSRKILLAVLVGPVLAASLDRGAALAQIAQRWERVGPPYPAVHAISVAQDGTDTLYAAASDPATGQSAVFRSEDAGGSWTLVAPALPGDTVSTIAVDPRDARRLFATTFHEEGGNLTRLYVSADSGTTWQFAGDFAGACGGRFVFDPRDLGPVYLTLFCTGDLLASPDAGQTWQLRNVSPGSLQAAPDGLLYGWYEGIVASTDGGFNFFHLPSPPCYLGSVITALGVDSSGRLFAGSGRVRMIFVDCGGVFVSRDGGQTWVETPTKPRPIVTGFAFDSADPDRMFVTSFIFGRGEVSVTVDSGANWRGLDFPKPPISLALSKAGRILYVLAADGLYRLAVRETDGAPPR